jgi:hypothetical protein
VHLRPAATMSNPVQTPSSSNEIITQDQKLLASLSLTPGLDTTTLNTTDSTNMMASPELALVWPLTDFASTTCSRPIATILRFLHFHALVARPTTPPTILIQTPEDLGNGRLEDEQLFVQLVREACRMFHRPCTEDATTSYDVVMSYFPLADQDQAQRLVELTNRCHGPLFVLCGDCEILGMPTSADDEKERGLDSLRVEMLLKQTFSSLRSSGASIAVEYARGGEDAKRAREENCALRKHQRNQLVGEQELLLLSQKWQMFFETNKKEGEQKTSTNGTSTNEDKPASPVLPPKIVAFQKRLRSWYYTRLVLWNEFDDETAVKLMKKHGTQESYDVYLRNAVVTKWIKQTGLKSEQLWEESNVWEAIDLVKH